MLVVIYCLLPLIYLLPMMLQFFLLSNLWRWAHLVTRCAHYFRSVHFYSDTCREQYLDPKYCKLYVFQSFDFERTLLRAVRTTLKKCMFIQIHAESHILLPNILNYMSSNHLTLSRGPWWRLFMKHVVWTKLNIYVFISILLRGYTRSYYYTLLPPIIYNWT